MTTDPPARKPRLRARGEGSVYQRADGRWVASIRLSDGTRRTRYRDTERAALKELALLQDVIQQGKAVMDERLTLGDYLVTWLEGRKATLKTRTWERYDQLIRLHLTPRLGKKRLLKLQPTELRAHYVALQAGGLSARSVGHVHALLHTALEAARRDELVERNIADLVLRPRAVSHEMQTLSLDQARALLAAAAGTRLEALYVLALGTGMRQGELLGLRWRDVDLEAGTLAIRTSLQHTLAGFVLDTTKTRGSRRAVELPAPVVEVLRRHRAAQAAEQLAAGDSWDASWELVFANERGRPIDTGNLTLRSFRPLLKAAGLPQIRFHDLRHTAATLLLAQGTHAKIVSELLGHTRIGITLDLYSHTTPTMHRQAAAAMAAVLFEPPPEPESGL